MGKGRKRGKATQKATSAVTKTGKAAKIANPAVKQAVQPDTDVTKSTNKSRANFTQDVNCGLCDTTNEAFQWFVQCDDCDKDFHFECVGITEIYEEDPWSCDKCLREKEEQNIERQVAVNCELVSQEVIQVNQSPCILLRSTPDETIPTTSLSNQVVSRMEVPVEVHADPSPRIEDVVDVDSMSRSGLRNSLVNGINSKNTQETNLFTQNGRQRLLTESQFKNVVFVEKKTSTRAASINPRIVPSPPKSDSTKSHSSDSRVRSGSSKARSSNSSQRWSGIDLERIEAELDLQTRLDEEKLAAELAVKLEAVRLKEKRERKFLYAKYKDISVHKGSLRSESTNRTSFVSDWVENQQKQVRARSIDDNIQQKTMNPLSAGDIDKSIKEQPAKSVDGNDQLLKKIDEFKFDWSITLDEEEQTQLTQLLRKSITSSKVQNSKVNDQSNDHADELNPGASTFIPHSQRHTKFVNHSTQPQLRVPNSSMTSTGPSQAQQSIVSNMNPTYDVNEIVKCQTQSTQSSLSQTQFNSSHDKRHQPIVSNLTWNRNGDALKTTQCQIWSDTCKLPILSTVASNYRPKSLKEVQHHQAMPKISEHCQSSNPSFLGNQPPISSMSNMGRDYHSSIIPGSTYSQPGYVCRTLTTNQIAARHAIPKDLPKFQGHTSNWLRFIKRFENSTQMCGYSNDENLERLDKALEGNARQIVESQLTIPDCVPEIIETLRQKFGRPDTVVKLTLADIRKEQSIKPNNLEALSNYGYKVRNVYKTIESLGLHYYLYNPELIQELVDKLPHQTKIDWARYSEEVPQTTLATLSNWLYKLSQSLNRIITPEICTNSNDSKRKPDQKSDNQRGGHVHVHNNQKSPEENSKCLICNKDCQYVGDCQKFKGLVVDERWKALIANKLCRKCLKNHRRSCYVSKECGINGCEYKHHPLLHNEQRHSKEDQNQAAQSFSIKSKKSTPTKIIAVNKISSGNINTHIIDCQEELFRIVPVTLHYNGRSVVTFAFLDEGSSFTLMERELADELNLTGTPETICLIWTKRVHRQEQSHRVNLEICGLSDPNNRYPLKSVNLVDDLGLPSQSISPIALAKRFDHLKDLPLVEYENAIPKILIGLKHARLSTPLETIEGGENDPIATRSRLGWSVHGPMNGSETTGHVNTHRVTQCPCKDQDEDIHKIVKDHFSIENFGVRANSMSIESKDSERAIELLKRYTVRKDGRFETRLLWKNESYVLPDSYGMAYKRLNCLENKGQAIIKIINDTIQDYMGKGYISKLTPAEAVKIHPRTAYLPIFTVKNPKKPEKIRPVFDAAAKVKGVSLNSALLTGPDLLSPIVDVLRRFRENRIAVSGDIKEMYHQVLVNEVDRDSQRFLWRNGEKEREPDVYVMNVMTFGATCSPSAAQYVKNVNASEFLQKYPRAAKAIIENHYVDDMMNGAATEEDAIKLVKDVKFIHSQAGFEIRNFISNSEQVLKSVGEPTDVCRKDLAEDRMKTERVLGMFWDTKLDCFVYSLKYTKVTSDILHGQKLPTKRELLKLVMSIFDPLGLLSYYLIHAKILLQDVWRSKIAWDDQLPENLSENWDRWIKLLPMVESLKIQRWYSEKLSPDVPKSNELHIFVDAGGEAFSAVAYLRIQDDQGCDCSLVGSKARVTPLKYLSTPRKELMGGVLGSRLINSVVDSLTVKIDRRVIWTDSRTLLIWLHSEHRKYSQFVGHRVGEILENTNLDEWRWVPTKLNVADEATKWSKKPTFESTDRWFTGPEYLKCPEAEWPIQETIVPNGTQEEMRLSCSHSQLIIPSIIEPNDVSTWERLHRGLATAIRFSKLLVAKCRKLKIPDRLVSQEDLIESERRLFQQAQWEGFTDEMITLTRNRTSDPKQRKSIDKESSIKDCSPYIDELGTLRVKGRIESAAAVTMDAKRPIILPRKHQITKLIVDQYHRKFGHQNHETVINELNQRFYIPQIRTVLKTVRWKCPLCKIRRSLPRPPQMADLPAVRFETGIRPFTYTGIDYFGPMYVKVGRQQHKRWGVLFTCLTIRAIHIEIAYSLNTESCIMSIRNFMARRGRPAHIYSDNGTNFKGADNELKRELKKLDEQQLCLQFTSCYTKWLFNPPSSPHMGGCWERLIRSVKASLKESMTTRTPSDEVLRNLLLESENVVNSRPPTFVPIDSEATETLTPNHFLLGTSNGLKPPGNFRSDGPYLRDCWKEVQRCTNIFWQRFIREYVPTLTRRTKWFDKVKPIEVGDLVINFDETKSRNFYVRARVVETITGSNGQVRRAKIQEWDGKTYWRPATLLGVLDVSEPAPTSQDCLDTPSEIKTGGNSVGAGITTARIKSNDPIDK